MSEREWITLGAGFIISALLAMTMGVALIYPKIAALGGKPMQRLGLAMGTIQPLFSLLLIAAVAAFNAPRGPWVSLILCMPIVGMSIFNYWSASSRKLDAQLHIRRST